jgi:hypothetical protein
VTFPVFITSIGTPTRPFVYLDNWALGDFSEHAALRERLLRILAKGTLLLSMLNLLETARARGQTIQHIASFLDAVGSRWAPVALSTRYVEEREDAGTEFPWRDEKNMPVLLAAPRVFWRPGNLVRRLQEPWAKDAVRKWEEQEVADIAAILGAGREGHRAGSLKLDRTTDVPAKLDTRAVFATITQRVVRKDVKLERHNIEDFLHTCVPVAHADAVLLDGKTKRALLERMDTPAKVFSATEVESALEWLETTWPEEPR